MFEELSTAFPFGQNLWFGNLSDTVLRYFQFCMVSASGELRLFLSVLMTMTCFKVISGYWGLHLCIFERSFTSIHFICCSCFGWFAGNSGSCKAFSILCFLLLLYSEVILLSYSHVGLFSFWHCHLFWSESFLCIIYYLSVILTVHVFWPAPFYFMHI